MDQQTYRNLLNGIGWDPSSYKDIAKCLMEKGTKEMYHAIVHQDDIQHLFTIPNLKIFWCCRCHLVAKDGSTAHEHLHALVQYQNKKTHEAFKHRLRRAGQRLHKKTTFKKILCPDHAVGVLRYITCRDGQRATRRNADGLMGAPHTHYRQSAFEQRLLHKRNAKQILGCKDIRLAILKGIKNHLTEDWSYENVSGHPHYLHHHETCLCEFGKIGKKKKDAANKKRREFYNTERGQEIKNMYKDRAQTRKELLEKVMQLQTGSNLAEMEKEKYCA